MVVQRGRYRALNSLTFVRIVHGHGRPPGLGFPTGPPVSAVFRAYRKADSHRPPRRSAKNQCEESKSTLLGDACSLFARFCQPDGDRLLAALHAPAFATGAALGLAALV